MNDAIRAFKDFLTSKPPEFYYDSGKKEFLMRQNCGTHSREWVSFRRDQLVAALIMEGLSDDKEKGEAMSPIGKLIAKAERSSDDTVHYSGPLAGYFEGPATSGNSRVLVTSSPTVIKPVKGDWWLIREFLEGMFGESEGEQMPYLLAWIKYAYIDLKTGTRGDSGGMPVITICGPKGCGKNVFQRHILTPILGGRSADPYKYLMGEDKFNPELFGAEHMMMSDPPAPADLRSRRSFGDGIKQMVANEEQRMRGMHMAARTATPYWRGSYSLNDAPECVRAIPPMDDHMEDKIMILRARVFNWPVPTLLASDRAACAALLRSQIPAFLHWLVNDWETPAHVLGGRWTVVAYHNPDIMALLNQVSPEFKLLQLIAACFLTPPVADKAGKTRPDLPLEMTAEELYAGLVSSDCPVWWEARELLKGGADKVSTYCSRLNRRFPDNVYRCRSSKARKWGFHDIHGLVNLALSTSDTDGTEDSNG